MTPKDDPHSIGNILIDMGLLSDGQFDMLLDQYPSVDAMLGNLMVTEGIISGDQLVVALRAQSSLRRDDKTERALGQAEVAEVSSATVIDMATRVRAKSTDTRRSITGKDHPAITAMLVKDIR